MRPDSQPGPNQRRRRMATTLLENTRQQHEDMERLERLIVKDFRTETKTYKDKLLQSHRVRGLLDALQSRAAALVRTLRLVGSDCMGPARCGCKQGPWAGGLAVGQPVPALDTGPSS